jgi:hypothetical protein
VPGSLDKKGGRRCHLLLNKRCHLPPTFLSKEPGTVFCFLYLPCIFTIDSVPELDWQK